MSYNERKWSDERDAKDHKRETNLHALESTLLAKTSKESGGWEKLMKILPSWSSPRASKLFNGQTLDLVRWRNEREDGMKEEWILKREGEDLMFSWWVFLLMDSTQI